MSLGISAARLNTAPLRICQLSGCTTTRYKTVIDLHATSNFVCLSFVRTEINTPCVRPKQKARVTSYTTLGSVSQYHPTNHSDLLRNP